MGIIGIGGLGQMGVRLAKAMGNTVTAISTSANKEAAAREIGADKYAFINLHFLLLIFLLALLCQQILIAWSRQLSAWIYY